MKTTDVYFYWRGDIDRAIQLALQSWLYHGYRVKLYTHDELSNVPSGVDIIDANDILPADNKLPPLPYSDRFRYLLIENGGWWSDCDLILLKPIKIDSQDIFFIKESDNRITTCWYYVPANTGFGLHVFNLTFHTRLLSNVAWGPAMVYGACEKFGWLNYLYPWEDHWPWQYPTCAQIFDHNDIPNKNAIHMFRFALNPQVDQLQDPHPDSILGQLYVKYGVYKINITK